MDLTNRAVIVGGALLAIFVILVIIILAWGAPDESIQRLGDLAGYLEDHNTTGAKLIVTFGGLILALLAAVVVVFEVSPPETGTLKVEKIGAGEARIGTDEVVHRLEEEIRRLPQIRQAQAAVRARGQKAEVNLDLHVSAEVDLAATAEEACRLARQLIEEQMGVPLARPPRALLHYRELHVARPQTGSPSIARQPQATAAPQASPAVAQSAPAAATNLPFATTSGHEASETSQEDRPASV
ncbi:MAG: hypothetical protein A2148_01775 [Chloroflexi bacterium RBG_16_68_14]|nr:MAG: hypothetical protein A2148_01775 [Chloroflexi bacterium RBG_16_68_14]